jgi:microcin C transport system substrate-binding protein
VDAILDRIPKVTSRAELVAILRAVDRVLRARHYWIANWYSADHRVAHWDIFGWPATKPDFGFAPESLWWLDRDKAAAAGKPEG